MAGNFPATLAIFPATPKKLQPPLDILILQHPQEKKQKHRLVFLSLLTFRVCFQPDFKHRELYIYGEYINGEYIIFLIYWGL